MQTHILHYFSKQQWESHWCNLALERSPMILIPERRVYELIIFLHFSTRSQSVTVFETNKCVTLSFYKSKDWQKNQHFKKKICWFRRQISVNVFASSEPECLILVSLTDVKLVLRSTRLSVKMFDKIRSSCKYANANNVSDSLFCVTD